MDEKKTKIAFRITFILLSLCLFGLLPASHAVADDTESELLQDLWMRVYLQDQRVGYSNMRISGITADGEARFLTEVTQYFRIARAGMELEFNINQEIEEDSEGNVTAFRQVMQQGPLRQEMSGKVSGDVMELVSGSGPDAVRQRVDAPRGLGPWAAERLAEDYGYDEGTAYSMDIFLIDAPASEVTVEVSVGSEEDIEIYGTTKRLRRMESSFSLMPGMTSMSWVDAAGRLWFSTTSMGAFQLTMRKAPKYAALQPIDEAAVAFDAAVEPVGELPADPSHLNHLRLKLTSGDSDTVLPEPPSGVYQTVQRQDDGIILTIHRPEDGIVWVSTYGTYDLPYEGEEKAHLLGETPWLEVNSPIIREMAAEAVGNEADAYRAAWKIERFVFEKIDDKTLDLGFATAAETARQLSGDCTEHAVLSAALARAAGIPSRVVVGLTYGGPMPGDSRPMFYYHMWTEAWVGWWMPLDAALGGYNVTSIAIAYSDLSLPDSVFDLTNATMSLMGRLNIEVLEYR